MMGARHYGSNLEPRPEPLLLSHSFSRNRSRSFGAILLSKDSEHVEVDNPLSSIQLSGKPKVECTFSESLSNLGADGGAAVELNH